MRSLTDEDASLFEAIEDMDAIVIVNKVDLEQKIDLDQVKKFAAGKKIVNTSLMKEEGIDELEEAIAAMFFSGEIEARRFNICIQHGISVYCIGQCSDRRCIKRNRNGDAARYRAN